MRQITILLPEQVIADAQRLARVHRIREDGLKNKPSSQLRSWLLAGWKMETRNGRKNDHQPRHSS